MTKDFEHFFMLLLIIPVAIFVKFVRMWLSFYWVAFITEFENSLYILDISPFSGILFSK